MRQLAVARSPKMSAMKRYVCQPVEYFGSTGVNSARPKWGQRIHRERRVSNLGVRNAFFNNVSLGGEHTGTD